MKALVTGAASGIGAAIAARLAAEGFEVVATDVAELDVSDAAAWTSTAARLDRLDVACLNAGVVTGRSSIADLTEAEYRRVLGTNVDGAVYGVRALLPLLEKSRGSVVVTASLAGLTTMESDPLYAATKHFLVGLVRSVAPQLAVRGVTIDAVCPGIVDTPLLGDGRSRLTAAGFPLLSPDDVAEAVLTALRDGSTGQAWVCRLGREPERYRFAGVPGPRVPGGEGITPPLSNAGEPGMPVAMPDHGQLRPRTVVTAVAITLSLLAVAYLTFLAWRVVTWIVIALFLALALDHAVRPLERRGVRRGLAVAIVFVTVLIGFAGVGFLLVPPLVAQVRDFVDALPELVDRLSRPIGFLEREFDAVERLREAVEQGNLPVAEIAGPLYAAVESAVIAVVALVSIVFLVLFLLLYGQDWARGLLGLVPRGSREYWERGARGIYQAIGGWVLGAAMIALITGIVTTTILLVMGAPYPFLLGIFVAILDPIPFVGATLGALVVALVLLGTEGVVLAVIFVLLFTAYTQVENNLLYPVIYGQTVKLSPLAVLVALLIGAQLAGIVGALASIPVAGAVQVVAAEVMRYRRDRDGETPTSTRPPPAPRRRGRTRA